MRELEGRAQTMMERVQLPTASGANIVRFVALSVSYFEMAQNNTVSAFL